MPFSSWIRSIFKSNHKKPAKRGKCASLNLEHLETRLAPYSASGGAWPNPQVITISFMPDGTQLSSAVGAPVTSNLFSKFNAKFGSAAAWENQFLKAAQIWAQQTNINFVVVPDNGAPSGSGSYEQGNPGFGDIRIGGYAFGNSTLANSYYPPQVDNYSIAGDIVFNTGQTFNIGSTYDLFTVAEHEFGHALGLGESSSGTNAVMYASYTGIKNALAADDIAGIQNIYSNNGPRTGGASNTLATATNISSLISSTSLTALDSNLNLATTADTDWYTFTAPTGARSSMTVQVQSQGLSLLTPKVTVYAANGTTVLGAANGLNQYQGSTLDVTVTGVTAGTRYYVKVQGADTTAFSTGDYALALNFGAAATQVEASPTTEFANGNPLTGGGGVADNAAKGDNYVDQVPTFTDITPDNGTSSTDGDTNTPNIALYGSAPAGNLVQLYLMNNSQPQYLGTTQANGENQWNWTYTGATLSSGNYAFAAAAVDGATGIESSLSNPFLVIIDTSTPSAPTVSVNNPATGAPIVFSNVTTPVVEGTAAPNTAISVFVDGRLAVPTSDATWTTMSSSTGAWSFTLPSALSTGVHTVTATDMTVAGTTGPSSTPYTFLVTSSAVNTPVILGIAPASGSSGNAYSSIANTSAISIGGLADAGATVNLYQSGGGSPPILLGSVVADSTGHWLYNDGAVVLSAGAYSFTANEVTAAGTSPTTAAFTATIDLATPATPSITGSALTVIPEPASPVITALSPAHSGYATGLTTAVTSGSLAACFTNSPTPTISGTAPAGSSVELFNNASYVGSTTANSNGAWSFTTPHLPDNIYNFTAVTVAASGAASAVSNPIRFIVSTVPPHPPTIQSIAQNSQQIVLTGMGDPGTTVNIYLGGSGSNLGTLVGTATVNSSGSWTFAYTSRAPLLGAYSFAVTETNLAGNTSQASERSALTINLLFLHLTL